MTYSKESCVCVCVKPKEDQQLSNDDKTHSVCVCVRVITKSDQIKPKKSRKPD